MKYRVHWQQEALDDLLELPEKTATAIVLKVESYLAQNPRQLGKPLTGQFTGLYRYRMGDYRIIYEITNNELRIHIVRIGHRKNIYN